MNNISASLTPIGRLGMVLRHLGDGLPNSYVVAENGQADRSGTCDRSKYWQAPAASWGSSRPSAGAGSGRCSAFRGHPDKQVTKTILRTIGL